MLSQPYPKKGFLAYRFTSWLCSPLIKCSWVPSAGPAYDFLLSPQTVRCGYITDFKLTFLRLQKVLQIQKPPWLQNSEQRELWLSSSALQCDLSTLLQQWQPVRKILLGLQRNIFTAIPPVTCLKARQSNSLYPVSLNATMELLQDMHAEF